MARIFIMLAALSAFLAVGLGAFGAHALKESLSVEMMKVYQTANQYHFYHSLGLLLLGVLALHWPDSSRLLWAGIVMFVGILVFSGSLYALSIFGWSYLGILTPFGGGMFILAWLLLFWAAWESV